MRFSSGEYLVTSLKLLSNKIHSGKDKLINIGCQKYPLYGSTGIIGYVPDYSNEGKKILVARVGANAGFSYMVDGKYCVTDNTLIIDPTDSRIINYLYYSIIRKRLNSISFGSGQPLVTGKQLNSLIIGLPHNNEEISKISNLFVAIDNKIETQKKIIKDILCLKNSIRDGFTHYEGRKYKILEIAEIGRGRVINSKEISQQNSPKYPVYSSQTLNDGIMGYLDNYDFDGEYITWTTDGANAGTVFYHNEKFNCTNVCGTLKIFSQDVDPFYLSLILESACKKYVSSNLANPKLMNSTMAEISVTIPDKKIQHKSSELVKSIDVKIFNEKRILELYQKQKDYLLNKMFI